MDEDRSIYEQGRPLFGFPQNFKDYELKHYLRLVIIILVYLAIRPFFVMIGNRVEAAQQKKRDEQLKRDIAEQVYEEVEVKNSSSASGAQTIRRKKTKDDIYDEMDSDPDVSDLMQ
jgi:hypothetical protein